MDKIIDCRNKKCSLEYSKISENFKIVENGGSIHLKTTTDPKKLFYEMLNKEDGNFYWIPVKDGPNEWDIMIEKTSTNKC
jgi:uncharacterized protein (DUF2249 family)